MNKTQKKILNFIKDRNPSHFITQDEIASGTGILPDTVGSECYKLARAEFLEPNLPQIGAKVNYRITVKGQNALDEEKLAVENWRLTKIGIISSIVLSSIAIIISILKQ